MILKGLVEGVSMMLSSVCTACWFCLLFVGQQSVAFIKFSKESMTQKRLEPLVSSNIETHGLVLSSFYFSVLDWALHFVFL